MITPISHLYLLTLLPLATTSPDEVALLGNKQTIKEEGSNLPGYIRISQQI
jgi:hypothetical protein